MTPLEELQIRYPDATCAGTVVVYCSTDKVSFGRRMDGWTDWWIDGWREGRMEGLNDYCVPGLVKAVVSSWYRFGIWLARPPPEGSDVLMTVAGIWEQWWCPPIYCRIDCWTSDKCWLSKSRLSNLLIISRSPEQCTNQKCTMNCTLSPTTASKLPTRHSSNSSIKWTLWKWWKQWLKRVSWRPCCPWSLVIVSPFGNSNTCWTSKQFFGRHPSSSWEWLPWPLLFHHLLLFRQQHHLLSSRRIMWWISSVSLSWSSLLSHGCSYRSSFLVGRIPAKASRREIEDFLSPLATEILKFTGGREGHFQWIKAQFVAA